MMTKSYRPFRCLGEVGSGGDSGYFMENELEEDDSKCSKPFKRLLFIGGERSRWPEPMDNWREMERMNGLERDIWKVELIGFWGGVKKREEFIIIPSL